MNIVNQTNFILDNVLLPGDSFDYDLLYRATASVVNIQGLICEIGIRRGGSLKYIIDAITQTHEQVRHLIAIDPYGNIDYATSDQFTGKLDYTNSMKNQSIPNIYRYIQGKNINFVFFNLEDTEFFEKFQAGVPVYLETKSILNTYSLVFFDGPHDYVSVQNEVNFFLPRSVLGSVFVFDDVQSYAHDKIDNFLKNNGFEVLEFGKQNRKISYKKVK